MDTASNGTATEYRFTETELEQIRKHIAKYPEPRSAVMPALWIAQEKYGWLPKEALKLVAETLNLSYAHVYGVASFYTMYFKKQVPKHVFDICTCFTCGECGGKEVFEHAKAYLNADQEGYSEDGQFFVRQAECLGACDTAPVVQVTNRHYEHNLDKAKIEALIESLRAGEATNYIQIPLSDQSVID